MALRNPDSRRLLGGIYVSHRLVTEAESARGAQRRSDGEGPETETDLSGESVRVAEVVGGDLDWEWRPQKALS